MPIRPEVPFSSIFFSLALVGDAYGLGADDGDEPLVDPQGQRAVELLVDPLMKRPVQPEGKTSLSTLTSLRLCP
jgi:hypothetical protein